MAPILSFTAEEVWGHLTKNGTSVHLEDLPEANNAWLNKELDETWSRLLVVRDEILKRLEIARKEKLIGHSLDALVEVHATGDTYPLLRKFEDQLASICIVSQVEVFGEDTPIPDDAIASETVKDMSIRVTKALGDKCPRCWQYRTTIGENAAHPDICVQCATAIS
jgi:isoleucyl-tRNA synthetase